MDETVEVTDGVLADGAADRPAVTHDEYLELVSMRQSLLELKAQKSDVLEFVNVAQQYAAQLQQAQQQLNAINEALTENTSALQERMKEIVEPLGVSGEFTITDTEPHFIVPNA
jgi:DNA anti-recombination protein RmuC